MLQGEFTEQQTRRKIKRKSSIYDELNNLIKKQLIYKSTIKKPFNYTISSYGRKLIIGRDEEIFQQSVKDFKEAYDDGFVNYDFEGIGMVNVDLDNDGKFEILDIETLAHLYLTAVGSNSCYIGFLDVADVKKRKEHNFSKDSDKDFSFYLIDDEGFDYDGELHVEKFSDYISFELNLSGRTVWGVDLEDEDYIKEHGMEAFSKTKKGRKTIPNYDSKATELYKSRSEDFSDLDNMDEEIIKYMKELVEYD